MTETTTILEKAGIGGYEEYRIPAIAVTDKGTVLTAWESRKETGNDWAECHITVRRSTDDGKSFGEPQYIKGTVPPEERITWNNTVLISDRNLVHLIFCQDYEKTWYTVSEDEGETFREPVEITETLRNIPWEWNVCATGPGHGILTKAGLLVVPIWLAMGKVHERKGKLVRDHFPSVAGCIYSEDHGKTWLPGFFTRGVENANETTVAEMASGKLLFNFRNERFERCRVMGITQAVPTKLETVWSETQLPDPTCCGSMESEDGTLYFVNCANHDMNIFYAPRIHLTLYRSNDDARTWEALEEIDPCGGYADLAIHENAAYILYERTVNGTIQELLLKKVLL